MVPSFIVVLCVHVSIVVVPNKREVQGSSQREDDNHEHGHKLRDVSLDQQHQNSHVFSHRSAGEPQFYTLLFRRTIIAREK